jgi:hypothetical protein
VNRLLAAFVAPAPGPAVAGADGRGGPAGGEDGQAGDVARCVAVLARPAEAFAVGGAVALAERLPLVCVWGAGEPAPPARAPALPGAARLAARLAARGHTAWATGRLAVATVADAAEAGRVLAAAAGGAVLVVAVPRAPAVDVLLAAGDLVLVAAPEDDPVTALALAELEALGVPARPVAAPTGPRRALAAAGLARQPAGRRGDVAVLRA